jgi:aminoglycoside phosphotransferase
MKQPDKWRETIDPFCLHFNRFQLIEVLGYPHAGNDVFYVKGIDELGELMTGFLKVERQKTADIEREVKIIHSVELPIIPKIVDYSFESPQFVLTKEIKGDRLSSIVGLNSGLEAKNYMANYGRLLAQIHELKVDCDPVKPRDFTLNHDFYHMNHLDYIETYLLMTERKDSYCFIHGDCHYANILWQGFEVCGLLDFELSGYGSREYDLAWALVLRPGQKFLKTKEERELFLESYRQIHSFNQPTFDYYLVLFSMYFYRIGLKTGDQSYCQNLLEIINEIILE